MNEQPQATQAAPRWRPIVSLDRRVLGVLGEKAKTTPDAYPMTLNALKTGCNQKNNRYPLMEVEIEDVEESLERLRGLGAVAELQGNARVNKYRHLLYDWLGVSKVEMAVMVELLLRGAQTEGELRGRAARMEPIADLGALRPVLASLKDKKLILSLTPEGRGHALTHALYEERELEKVRREYAHSRPAEDSPGAEASHAPANVTQHAPAMQHSPAAVQGSSISHGSSTAHRANAAPGGSAAPGDAVLANIVSAVETLKSEVAELQTELARARKDLDDLWSQLR